MDLTFILFSAVTLGSAILAVSLRNLVHCALALALSFAGLAALYLKLNAQFVGFAQILIYIGAIAILIVFAILLTRGAESSERSRFAPGWLAGLGVAAGLGLTLISLILSSKALVIAAPEIPVEVNVRQIGEQLMTRFVLPLEVAGLLLTAALIGAVVIAMREPGKEKQ
jgi:NADH:ubiquinone oxidoreductase subunit 6 (subunit J)